MQALRTVPYRYRKNLYLRLPYLEELINHDGVLTKGDVYDAWPEVRTRSVSGYDPGSKKSAWGGMPELGRMEFHFNPDENFGPKKN